METSRKQRIYRTIMLLILSVTITFLVTTVYMYKILDKGEKVQYISTGLQNSSTVATTLEQMKEIVDTCFLGEIDEQKMLDGAIEGYINALDDPYTEYLTKDEMISFTQDTLGNYTGIGIYMAADLEKNQIVVLQPIKDTPAYKAGLQPGDIILKVDGISYTADEMTEASNKIKGLEGTTVELEISRNDEIKTLKMVREYIKLYHIESEILENNIGYLELVTFDEGCCEEFKTKYEELKSKGITSLIIDLRNNGGGIVDEAVDIADLMVEKDKDLLITVDKNNNEKIVKSKQDVVIDMPIVVLVNENTASASEILTGILQDYEKAAVVGVPTYGKGVIQQLIQLSDGSGLKITTNQYFTPNRKKIQDEGLEPEFVVHLPTSVENILEVEREKDTQLKEAIEILK